VVLIRSIEWMFDRGKESRWLGALCTFFLLLFFFLERWMIGGGLVDGECVCLIV
jgi:hypothetical protein